MKVLLIDDHPLILSALESMIRAMDGGIAVVCAEGAVQADAALAREPDITLVLLDLTLADADGFELLARIRQEHPALPVVVISASDRLPDVVRAVDLGAMGYVSKRSSNTELLHALSLVMAGGVYVPTTLMAQGGELPPMPPGLLPAQAPLAAPVLHLPAGPADAAAGGAAAVLNAQYLALGLTPRQCEVLALLLKGLPNKLIARELNLSVETIKDHVAAVLRALGVTSRTQAVLAVSRLGQSATGR